VCLEGQSIDVSCFSNEVNKSGISKLWINQHTAIAYQKHQYTELHRKKKQMNMRKKYMMT
jgi:hypothetical protein